MVISKILVVLQQSRRIPLHSVVAVHIDYANRPESSREAAYVQQWCDNIGKVLDWNSLEDVTN